MIKRVQNQLYFLNNIHKIYKIQKVLDWKESSKKVWHPKYKIICRLMNNFNLG